MLWRKKVNMEMIVQVLGSLFHPLALGVNIFGVV